MEKEIQNNKLQLLGKLSAALVHDLRNPLSALKLNLDYIQMLENEYDDKFKTTVNDCRDAIDRISYLVENTLKFAKKDAGEDQICFVNDVLSQAAELTRSFADKEKIKFDLKLGKDIPAINVNPMSILQVFINLITNALEASSAGSEIVLSSYIEDGSVIVQVKDFGSGISDDLKSKIFDDFFTTKKNGTGIGLSVCKMIVEKHSAGLEFSSTPGKETCFYVIFPSKNKGDNED